MVLLILDIHTHIKYTHIYTQTQIAAVSNATLLLHGALTGTIFPFLWISIQLAELCYLNFIQHFSRRLLNN